MHILDSQVFFVISGSRAAPQIWSCLLTIQGWNYFLKLLLFQGTRDKLRYTRRTKESRLKILRQRSLEIEPDDSEGAKAIRGGYK